MLLPPEVDYLRGGKIYNIYIVINSKSKYVLFFPRTHRLHSHFTIIIIIIT